MHPYVHPPHPVPHPVPHPPRPPQPLHTQLGTRTHRYSQCTCVCRACTYSRVLQLPYACLSCTLRVRTAASQVPPPFAQHDCTQMFAGHVKPPSYSTASSGYPRLSTLCRRLQLHPALTTRASLQAPSTPRPPPRSPPHPHPPTPHTHPGTRTDKNSQCTYVYRACAYSRVLHLSFACLSGALRVRAAASQIPPRCSARVYTNIRGARTALLPYRLFRVPTPRHTVPPPTAASCPW